MSEAAPDPEVQQMERAKQQAQNEDFRREGVSKMRDMIMQLMQEK